MSETKTECADMTEYLFGFIKWHSEKIMFDSLELEKAAGEKNETEVLKKLIRIKTRVRWIEDELVKQRTE